MSPNGLALTAAGTVATLLVALLPAGPAVARPSLECFAAVPGATIRGIPTTLRYEDGTTTSEKRGPDDLGYQPRDVAYPHPTHQGRVATFEGYPRRAATVTSYWFTLTGSQLREVVEMDQRDAQGRLVSAAYRTRVVRKRWEGVRQISIGSNRGYLYALTNTDQLLRYRLTGKSGNVTAKFDQVVGAGFGTIGTFEYTRTITALGARSDVFVATDADSGALIEFAIPKDDPASFTRTVLADAGWSDMRSAGRTASCLDPKSGDLYDGIVAVGLDGTVRLWTDRDGSDSEGGDIVEWGVLKTAWKPMPYSD